MASLTMQPKISPSCSAWPVIPPRVGLALLAAHGVVRQDEAGIDAAKLADELECWTEQYSRLWHEVSRQSELARIQHVVWRAADVLRSI